MYFQLKEQQLLGKQTKTIKLLESIGKTTKSSKRNENHGENQKNLKNHILGSPGSPGKGRPHSF